MANKAIYLFLITILSAGSCTRSQPGKNSMIIHTNYGDISVKLFPEQAPRTVAAFIKNVDADVYTKSSFYRVVKSENVPSSYQQGLIQGGIFETNPELERKLNDIPHEAPATTGISHTNGTISLARNKPGTARSEFFICVGDQTQFDSSRRANPDGQGYAAFGRVYKGMSVVKKIFSNSSEGDVILHPVKIKSITYYR